MEKLINERRQQMVSLKDAADETEESMRVEVNTLKQKNEELAASIRRMGWDANDQLKEKDLKIKRCVCMCVCVRACFFSLLKRTLMGSKQQT